MPAKNRSILIASLLLAAPLCALAQFGLPEAVENTGIPTETSIPLIIGNLIRVALSFVGTLFLLLVLYAGFLWMTSRGDSSKVDQAKQMLVSAVIGVIIVASAYAITSFVLVAATGGAS